MAAAVIVGLATLLTNVPITTTITTLLVFNVLSIRKLKHVLY
jgi:hypothetical protein